MKMPRPKEVVMTLLKMFPLDAKLRAYNVLLSKKSETWTDHEIEIGYALACDPDVQAHIAKHLKAS